MVRAAPNSGERWRPVPVAAGKRIDNLAFRKEMSALRRDYQAYLVEEGKFLARQVVQGCKPK
jgi:hypothetical protein